MGFQLANVNGRAVLVSGDQYFDVATLSGGVLPSDLMEVLSRADELRSLAATLGAAAATGRLADVELGPPVPRPQKSFGVGLNYLGHAQE